LPTLTTIVAGLPSSVVWFQKQRIRKQSATFRKNFVLRRKDYCLTNKNRIGFVLDVLTTAGFAKVESHQLDHVRLKKVDVPPGRTLHFGQAACFRREEIAGATIDSSFGNAASSDTRLHRRLTSRHIQNWKSRKKSSGHLLQGILYKAVCIKDSVSGHYNKRICDLTGIRIA